MHLKTKFGDEYSIRKEFVLRCELCGQQWVLLTEAEAKTVIENHMEGRHGG